MKIYVVTHKPVDLQLLALDKCYSVIRVGQYAREQNGLLSDAEGNNIAEKNPNYCELTAQYWMWKNDTTSEVKEAEGFNSGLIQVLVQGGVYLAFPYFFVQLKSLRKSFKVRNYDILLSPKVT